MRDRKDNIVSVGDSVIFVANVTKGAYIERGYVEKIYPDRDMCTVTDEYGYCHRSVMSQRILQRDAV